MYLNKNKDNTSNSINNEINSRNSRTAIKHREDETLAHPSLLLLLIRSEKSTFSESTFLPLNLPKASLADMCRVSTASEES